MPDKIIDIPGVGHVAFPESMADADIEKASAKLYSEHHDASVMPTTAQESSAPSSLIPAAGLALAGASKIAAPITTAVTDFATNPAVPKIGSAIGKAAGGLAPVVAGALEGGPLGALVGIAAASKGAWAGSKTGWFTAKMLQQLGIPAAKLFEKVAPYADAATLPLAAASAEADALNRLNDPSELKALEARLSGQEPAGTKHADYIDTLNRWLGTVKAAQQVAPNTVLSAQEIKQLDAMVATGIPVPIATQTVLQLRQGGAR